MEKRRKIICLSLFLFFLISCNSDYKYEYKSNNDPDNSFIVKTLDNRTKMIISTAYQSQIQDNLYYLRVNNEFYQCDGTFSIDSIIDKVQFSTIKEYRVRSQKFKIDKLIIQPQGNFYITVNNMTDYTGTISLKYFYDKDYKIFKIEDNDKIYTIQ